VDADVLPTGGDTGVQGGLVYGQRQFSCHLFDAALVPTHVTLAINRCTTNTTMLLPVQLPERSPVEGRWLREFTFRAEVNFGSFPVDEVVEWIEANVLFGVRRFYIYNGNAFKTAKNSHIRYYAIQSHLFHSEFRRFVKADTY